MNHIGFFVFDSSRTRSHAPGDAVMAQQSVWGTLKRTGKGFIAHKAPRMAAAIAFFTIFSLGPILIIVISIAGLIWGERAVKGEIADQVEGTLGKETAQMLQTVIANAAETDQGTWGLIIGIGVLLVSATVVFAQLKGALNTTFQVKPKPGRAILSLLRDRGLAFVMVLVIAALLIASLIVGSVIAGLGEEARETLRLSPTAIQIIELLISAIVITLLFALTLKYLPDIRIAWRDVWVGAAVTAVLFVIGKFAVGIYLGRAGVAGAYGAAGGLIMVLLWVYFSMMIFLLGAEFTRAWAERQGKRVEPSKHAETIEVGACPCESRQVRPEQAGRPDHEESGGGIR
jgi:membrane protein